MPYEMKPSAHNPANLKEISMKTNRTVCSIVACLTLSVAGSAPWGLVSADERHDGQQQVALVKAIPQSKLTLIGGIKQVTKDGEVPISAKFEFDDAGKLSLSVYTVEKGLNSDPEHNVLKELSGSPEQDAWNPEAEVFKDVPHVARSSEQLTLMRLSPFTLVDILTKVQKTHRGIVFSITPAIKGHQPAFVVLEATGGGKVAELDYNLLDGSLLTSGK